MEGAVDADVDHSGGSRPNRRFLILCFLFLAFFLIQIWICWILDFWIIQIHLKDFFQIWNVNYLKTKVDPGGWRQLEGSFFHWWVICQKLDLWQTTSSIETNNKWISDKQGVIFPPDHPVIMVFAFSEQAGTLLCAEKAKCWPILAHFGYFVINLTLFGTLFTSVSGVPKLTKSRYNILGDSSAGKTGPCPSTSLLPLHIHQQAGRVLKYMVVTISPSSP